MNQRRPYVRPMAGWWKKSPYFVEYMVHEGSALFVALYAIVLLVGVLCLMSGPAAWNGWLAALASPLSVLLHLIILAMVGYHSYTWFKIMPRTLPPVILAGRRLSARCITTSGLAAVAFCSVALWLLAWGCA